eukprot:3484864-Rhodomonas_salina.5
MHARILARASRKLLAIILARASRKLLAIILACASRKLLAPPELIADDELLDCRFEPPSTLVPPCPISACAKQSMTRGSGSADLGCGGLFVAGREPRDAVPARGVRCVRAGHQKANTCKQTQEAT